MKEQDKKILEDFGWTIESESPLELTTIDGALATGEAATIILYHLSNLKDKPSKYKKKYKKLKIKFKEQEKILQSILGDTDILQPKIPEPNKNRKIAPNMIEQPIDLTKEIKPSRVAPGEFLSKATCPTCDMDFSGVTGYVCQNPECPIQPQIR